MAARLLVLGLDAANPELVRRWAADGTLPNLGRLFAGGRHGTVRAAEGFFTATWPCIYTGCSPAEHGFHYQAQLRPGTYSLYDTGTGDLSRREPFWRALSRAGKRVAILDVPLVPLDTTVNGVHLIEWGGHDAVYGFATSPVEIGQQILTHEGAHPQPGRCDGIRQSVDEYRALIEALEQGTSKRAAFSRRILKQDDWDLFLHVFSEAHCVGHQCWHLHDTKHPAHDAALVTVLGDPLRRVYAAIDRAIGEILDAAGQATVVVFSGHGMAHWYGAHFLLRDILVRLGVTVPAPPTRIPPFERMAQYTWMKLPVGARKVLKTMLRPVVAVGRNRSRAAAPALSVPALPVDAAASHCFPLGNGLAATGIRINLRGREPAGQIEPGAEQEAFEDELIQNLMEIVDERTGRPLVRTVLRTRELYAGAVLNALPDLLVEWNDTVPTGSAVVSGGVGATVRARSESIGVVEGINDYCRTGEHRNAGFIVAAGADITPGVLAQDISVMDLAPTFADYIGVPLPDVDGVAAPSLFRRDVTVRSDSDQGK